MATYLMAHHDHCDIISLGPETKVPYGDNAYGLKATVCTCGGVKVLIPDTSLFIRSPPQVGPILELTFPTGEQR